MCCGDYQKAQNKYKAQYDKSVKIKSPQFKIGEWILIRYPQEESGSNWRLSRPWYVPFWITSVEKTEVTAKRIYGNSTKGQIRVHLQWVTRCPPVSQLDITGMEINAVDMDTPKMDWWFVKDEREYMEKWSGEKPEGNEQNEQDEQQEDEQNEKEE